jgi:hypothetical protein
MVTFHLTGAALWERMGRAVEKVQERLERTATILEAAGIPYAIIGGNAVQAWVAQADESAVRTTRGVDILLRRADFSRAIEAMERAGFVYRHVKSIDMFLDGPGSKVRDAVHVVFAGEKVRPEDPLPAPDVDESVGIQKHQVLRLESLVRMKLTSFRDKDRMHLRDMLEVELFDESWRARLPIELSARLQELLTIRTVRAGTIPWRGLIHPCADGPTVFAHRETRPVQQRSYSSQARPWLNNWRHGAQNKLDE